MVAYARKLGLDPQRTALDFADYWHAKAGHDARKVDWEATWRRWCRQEAERRGTIPPPRADPGRSVMLGGL